MTDLVDLSMPVGACWLTGGHSSGERAKARLRWLHDRIRVPRACELAGSQYEEAPRIVDRA